MTSETPPAAGDDVGSSGALRWLGARPFWGLVRFEEMVAGVLMCAILAAIAVQVAFRYVFKSPLIWTDELARFAVVWLTFIGAAFVAAHERHIAVEFMDSALGERRLRYVRFLALAGVIVACTVMIVGSIGPIEMAARRHSTALGVPLSLLAIAAPVGFLLIAIHGLGSMIRLIRRDKGVASTADGRI